MAIVLVNGVLELVCPRATGPVQTATHLASVGAIWIGLAIGLRRWHGRVLESLTGPLRPRTLLTGATLGIGLWICTVMLTSLLHAAPEPSDLAVRQWVPWLGPLLLLVVLQAGAEEALFRGYLAQEIALRLPHPAAWAGIPALIFALLHLDTSLPPLAAVTFTLSTGIFGLIASILVWRSGSLWPAIAFHAGRNALVLTGVGIEGQLDDAQLWLLPAETTQTALGIDLVVVASLLAFLLARRGRGPAL
ncbi:MAG: type II CAAX endopeptidase family protein [Pseudomonadota bacterium]